MAEAKKRKKAKYEDLLEAGRAAGYRTELMTVEIGSRGMLAPSDLELLSSVINCSRAVIKSLCLLAIRHVLPEYFKIWCSRNVSN